ncbi:MAG TPA: SPOR domain-containing protein [Thermoanaerobaculia bacterium]|nr:SPOR domain-containing protein [Thermoanaerobaculia bacterium]
MSEELLTDDQSHYEISLTAGQAFMAFVLLLLSLAAAFAFGLVIGRGQGEDRLVVKKEPAVISEAAAIKPRNDGKIVELGADDFKQKTDTTGSAAVAAAGPSAVPAETATTVVETTTTQPAQTPALQTPVYAQLLVSADQKTAETLAATLIDKGFTTAYVERAGTTFKVRVKFNSESEARAAEPKLKEFAKDVWIVK